MLYKLFACLRVLDLPERLVLKINNLAQENQQNMPITVEAGIKKRLMKHVCFLTGLYSRSDSLMFERQGKSLAANGFRVTYVVCDNKPNEFIEGIEIISTNYSPKNRLMRFLNTKKILYGFAQKINADIYQISDPELVSLGVRLKGKGNGYKVIYNMRENYPAEMLNKHYLPKYIRKLVSNWLAKYMARSFSKFDAIFTVTPDLVELVKSEWGILNTYLLANFPPINTNYCLNKEDYLSRPDTLLYFGTIYNISRQEILFKALERIPEIDYILAGVVEEGNDIITSLPYWSKVKFINRFQRNQLPGFFAKATISNCLRDFSSTGVPNGSLGVIKIFESMEAALPVLLPDVKLYRKMVEKHNCGICVNPNDADEIEQALRYLIENKEEAYQMGQNGRQAVLEEYNWQTQAKTYIGVLNELCYS